MGFSTQLRAARIAAGLTQRQVAEAMGITNSTYCGYETGKREPDVAKIKQLSKILDIPADDLLDTGITPHKKPIFSSEALQLAQDYDRMDIWGQKALRDLADNELARIRQAHISSREDSEPDNVIYITRFFLQPMSAGTGTVAGDDNPEELELTKRPPRGTSYVAPVRGDSMEPTYHDGDKLFIRTCEEIEVGQIGVFWMDGKQWVKEQGEGVLISHNPKYAPRPMTEGIRCQGLVLGVCDESYFE